jgi:hypothetical protein
MKKYCEADYLILLFNSSFNSDPACESPVPEERDVHGVKVWKALAKHLCI